MDCPARPKRLGITVAANSLGGWLVVLPAGVAVSACAYVTYAALAWCRFGHVREDVPDEHDHLLDRFIPSYDIAERHHIAVDAPADVTLVSAEEQELFQFPLVRAIVKLRELALGAMSGERDQPRGLLAATMELGWGILSDIPGREIILGAVTKPWQASVTFRSLPPDAFAAFSEPGCVKIAWTLRADPTAGGSVFRTETRAVATDVIARRTFRRYWALVAPGIRLIRWLSLKPLKREAERRAARPPVPTH